MPLDFPLNNQEKGSIESANFAELKARQFKGGLPVFTSVPTYVGSYGEMVLLYSSSTYQLYSYLNEDWRKIGDSKFTATAGAINNIVEDTTPQLGGDLDMNGKGIDFPTTANITDVLDEDTMASDSATKLATQQSIKAYVDSKIASYTVGDYILIEDTTEVSNNVTANDTKVAEFTLDKNGALRIKFDLKIGAGGAGSEAYAQIYRNGVAVGTRQQDDSSTNYVTFSEDISGWSNGDLVQLYSKTSNATYPAYTRNFRLYASDYIGRQRTYVEIVPVSLTPDTVDAWTDWDLNASIPTGAKYVEVFMAVAFGVRTFGLRKNGSALARTVARADDTRNWSGTWTVGLDTGRVLEYYVSNTDVCIFKAIGYWI
jgi:hypothetical protein